MPFVHRYHFPFPLSFLHSKPAEEVRSYVVYTQTGVLEKWRPGIWVKLACVIK
jgi:hypothetical protein